MTKDALRIDGLEKRYGAQLVLQGLNLRVQRGEIFALLGVNGAGKTTALECVEGLRRYDAGHIAVSGRLGIQPQAAALPAHIRPLEAVRLFAKWNRAKPDSALLAALGIDALAKKQYAQLSMGQKRRLHLALALTGDPDIVFLDEPTAGLDVEGRLSLHDLIRQLKARGKTVILASHDMAEVEELCDRLAILSRGRLVFLGTVAELTARVGRRYNLRIQTDRGEECHTTDDVAGTLLNLLGGYRQQGLAVLDVRVDRGSLEQHFIQIARGLE